VLRQPNPPVVLILRLADSGIELELAVWIGDPENGQNNLRSALYLRIWRAFRAAGVKIPYPQREIRLVAEAAEGAPEAPSK
jgi:small-conductance mechanosensitive channel